MISELIDIPDHFYKRIVKFGRQIWVKCTVVTGVDNQVVFKLYVRKRWRYEIESITSVQYSIHTEYYKLARP